MARDDDTRPISRRSLLWGGAGVVAAGAVATAEAATRKPNDGCTTTEATLLPQERIGIQLYTVRDQIQSLGFAKTFEKLATMGFREVEFAGYTQGTGTISVKQIRKLLDANGLKAIGCHSDATPTTMNKVLDDAQTLGMPYVGIADAPNAQPLAPVSTWQQSADDMNKMGAAAKKRGLRFYWHNHSSEFTICADSPTTRAYDVLLAETDPGLVFMEMDIYWAYVGQFQYGQSPLPAFDPVSYVLKHPNRYPLFHVKDGRRNPQSYNGYDIVDVGQGDIDFERFFKKVGGKTKHHYLNENDEAGNHPGGSLKSARCSYAYMRTMR
jgi:sugar phosphate isomerase/epimerase